MLNSERLRKLIISLIEKFRINGILSGQHHNILFPPQSCTERHRTSTCWGASAGVRRPSAAQSEARRGSAGRQPDLNPRESSSQPGPAPAGPASLRKRRLVRHGGGKPSRGTAGCGCQISIVMCRFCAYSSPITPYRTE